MKEIETDIHLTPHCRLYGTDRWEIRYHRESPKKPHKKHLSVKLFDAAKFGHLISSLGARMTSAEDLRGFRQHAEMSSHLSISFLPE